MIHDKEKIKQDIIENYSELNKKLKQLSKIYLDCKLNIKDITELNEDIESGIIEINNFEFNLCLIGDEYNEKINDIYSKNLNILNRISMISKLNFSNLKNLKKEREKINEEIKNDEIQLLNFKTSFDETKKEMNEFKKEYFSILREKMLNMEKEYNEIINNKNFDFKEYKKIFFEIVNNVENELKNIFYTKENKILSKNKYIDLDFYLYKLNEEIKSEVDLYEIDKKVIEDIFENNEFDLKTIMIDRLTSIFSFFSSKNQNKNDSDKLKSEINLNQNLSGYGDINKIKKAIGVLYKGLNEKKEYEMTKYLGIVEKNLYEKENEMIEKLNNLKEDKSYSFPNKFLDIDLDDFEKNIVDNIEKLKENFEKLSSYI